MLQSVMANVTNLRGKLNHITYIIYIVGERQNLSNSAFPPDTKKRGYWVLKVWVSKRGINRLNPVDKPTGFPGVKQGKHRMQYPAVGAYK